MFPDPYPASVRATGAFRSPSTFNRILIWSGHGGSNVLIVVAGLEYVFYGDLVFTLDLGLTFFKSA
jgi:hypothetical protein